MASFKVASLPVILVGAAGLMAAPQAGAQPFEILHAFENPPAVPSGALVHGPDGLVYGTTEAGGKYDLGTVFRFEPESGRLTVLHHFAGGDDGMSPGAGLVWGGDAFYGTTSGQSYSQPKQGTVFRITLEGVLETLHVFQGPDGRSPRAQLVLVGAYLYGTTESGGTSEKGTVFRVQVGSSAGFESLHSFAGYPSDGYQPVAGLSPATDGRLFGTTCYGGSANRGTIFEIGTSGLTVVHSFTPTEGSCPYGEPLIDANGDLVGTAYGGGAASSGTIYRYRQSGVLEVLYDFPTGSSPMGGLVQGPDGLLYGLTNGSFAGAPGTLFRLAAATNALETLHTFDTRAFPRGRLLVDGTALLGTTAGRDGYANQGTLFRRDVGGTLTVLHRFGMSGVGWTPLSLAVGDGSTLYGTTRSGGAYGRGTVFELNSTGALAVYAFPRHEAEGAASDTDARVTPGGETDLLYGVRRSESLAVRGSVFTLRPSTRERVLLHEFVGSDGSSPSYAPTITRDGQLWGPASGGAGFRGVVYRMSLDGSGFTDARSFNGYDGDGPSSPPLEATDGFLYGTTVYGPTDFYGAVGCGILYRASSANGWLTPTYTFPKNGSNGCAPSGRLVEGPAGGIYGGTGSGGPLGGGVVYRLDPTVSPTPTIVRAFAGGADGASPHDLVYAPDGFLYGAAYLGTHGKGLVFRLRPDGTEYAVVHEFDGDDGMAPDGLVVGADRHLYGFASWEGPEGGGVVFRIVLAPTASTGGPYTVAEGGTVPLTATGEDPTAGPVTFTWDLDGDGEFDDLSGPEVDFVAGPERDGPGTYPIAVRVTSEAGVFTDASGEVTVSNVAPAVSAQPSSPATVDLGVEVSLQVSFEDPGPDAWTTTVEFGDGVTQTRELESPGSFGVTHVYAAPGVYRVSVTVADDDGGSGQAQLTFTVRSAAESIGVLIAEVGRLVELQKLSPGRGNSLKAKLRAALAAIEAGDTLTAIETLTSFINEAEAFKKVGILEPADVDPLIAIAQAALAALSG